MARRYEICSFRTFNSANFFARTLRLCSTRELAPALSASLGVSVAMLIADVPLLPTAGLDGIEGAPMLEPLGLSLSLLPTMT